MFKCINGKVIAIFIVWCLSISTYALAITTNSYTISNGAMVIAEESRGLLADHHSDETVAVSFVTPLVEEEFDPIVASSAGAINPSREEIKNEIIKQSRIFGLDENMMLELARCENDTFDPERKNPISTAAGIYQYTFSTWSETQSAKNGIERTGYKANIREAMIDVANEESWRWRDCGYKLKAIGFNF